MFCMFITLVSYFISVRQVYDTFIVHTLTEDVKVKRSSQMDIRIGNFFSATYCKLSLSSQLSSVALIAQPTTEQPHYPTALKSHPVRRVLPVAGLCRRGADSRQPRSQPPTKPRRQAAHASRASLFTKKKPNQPHPAASSAQPIQLQTHSPSTQASSFPVKTLLKKWITGPSPKAVTSVPIPTTPPVR